MTNRQTAGITFTFLIILLFQTFSFKILADKIDSLNREKEYIPEKLNAK